MKILIVIPCYNEEEVLPKTLEVLGNLIKNIKKETDADTGLLLVDDGSRDHTWQMISDAAKEHRYVHGIKLSHNRGHQNALWAGMEAAVDHCDAMVSIDADLQDDENVIIDMVRPRCRKARISSMVCARNARPIPSSNGSPPRLSIS